jgi:hypothetical protein
MGSAFITFPLSNGKYRIELLHNPFHSTVMNSQGNSSRNPSSSEQQVGKKLNTFLFKNSRAKNSKGCITSYVNLLF